MSLAPHEAGCLRTNRPPTDSPCCLHAGPLRISLPSLIWAREDLDSYEKIVLLCLAEHADEQGNSLLTIALICAKCSMKQRGVQGVLRRLVLRGLLIADCGGGRYKSNRYRIMMAPTAGTEAKQSTEAPRAVCDCANTPHPMTETPHPVQGILHEIPKQPPDGDFVAAPSRKKTPVQRGLRLPQNWVPSDKNLSDAQSRNFTDKEIEHEAHQFRDYHLARGTVFKDWNAAWRTWLGNARQYRNRGLAGTASPGRGGSGSSLASIVARRHAEG